MTSEASQESLEIFQLKPEKIYNEVKEWAKELGFSGSYFDDNPGRRSLVDYKESLIEQLEAMLELTKNFSPNIRKETIRYFFLAEIYRRGILEDNEDVFKTPQNFYENLNKGNITGLDVAKWNRALLATLTYRGMINPDENPNQQVILHVVSQKVGLTPGLAPEDYPRLLQVARNLKAPLEVGYADRWFKLKTTLPDIIKRIAYTNT